MDSGNLSTANAATSDLSRYREHVAHMGLSPEQESQLLETVWRMMGNFVDRAFGDDPVQHVHENVAADEKPIRAVLGFEKATTPQDDTRPTRAFSKSAAGRTKKERT